MMPPDWDGNERREAQRLAQDLRTRTVEVPRAAVVVGFAAVALMVVAALWGLVIISGNITDESARQDRFRDQLSCFVIGITQGKPGADLLTSCEFLTIGGN